MLAINCGVCKMLWFIYLCWISGPWELANKTNGSSGTQRYTTVHIHEHTVGFRAKAASYDFVCFDSVMEPQFLTTHRNKEAEENHQQQSKWNQMKKKKKKKTTQSKDEEKKKTEAK